jgi:hypothetical protein
LQSVAIHLEQLVCKLDVSESRQDVAEAGFDGRPNLPLSFSLLKGGSSNRLLGYIGAPRPSVKKLQRKRAADHETVHWAADLAHPPRVQRGIRPQACLQKITLRSSYFLFAGKDCAVLLNAQSDQFSPCQSIHGIDNRFRDGLTPGMNQAEQSDSDN